MSRFHSIGVFCTALFCLTPAAMAKSTKLTLHICTLKVSQNQIWGPDHVVIEIHKSDGKVLVFDPLIRHFMNNPIQAEVVIYTPDRFTLKWNLNRVNKVRPYTMPTIVYTAKLTKKDNRIAINVTPLGYDSHFYADGICKVQD